MKCHERCGVVVAQASKPAVSPTSKSAELRLFREAAGLETCDTADLEVCATMHRNCLR